MSRPEPIRYCRLCRDAGLEKPATRVVSKTPMCTAHAAEAYRPRLMSPITVERRLEDWEIEELLSKGAVA